MEQSASERTGSSDTHFNTVDSLGFDTGFFGAGN